ncbi:hypothetical protein B0J13DRAFT_251705 [Dactylonectria estremocensis]|uniref:Uncharacterized protein n=1 Tax=Dactylonectria estremocensis TaxID=1079267 RepID=A0A9P9F3E6_9HYPO|nr:hypothetical protein B0J13DRAFT_251705 [Dactylonectria estremocensis]
MNSNDTQPKFGISINGQNLDIADAVKQHADLAREALIEGLLSVPLDDSHLTRIRLHEIFRRSLSAKRDTTPYRLQSVIDEARRGNLHPTSLDARFYDHGGARAVAAYAAAAADQKQVVSLLETLSNEDFHRLLKAIDRIEPHPDLRYIIERACRKTPTVPSKRKYIAGPRRRRTARQSSPSSASLGPTTRPSASVAGGQRPKALKQRESECLPMPSTPADPSAGLSTDLFNPVNALPMLDLHLANYNDDLSRFTMPHCHGSIAADDLDQFLLPHIFGDQVELDLRVSREETDAFNYSGGPEYSE